ncbi:ATP synthase [Russula earlei]|uniref:ATP synthase n=1 Tax=Russula earlei TaxID=71964 RepID=A0ACC0UH25_9AGAM|nr:ATP synthase [Russula earlei]
MASRIAFNSLRASASRACPHAALPQILPTRTMASSSSSNPPPPAERAAEIIDKLPSHPSLITKTGTAILGSGLLATAISQELYVFNEETVIAVGSFILFAYIAKTVRLPYKEWAESHIARIKSVLDGARAEHTQAVKDRIDAVGEMKDVVSLTQGLFDISKETARLEADAFVQRQRVALAAEVKAVLDSWVRFEQQEKENEQARLAKAIVDNVLKTISEEKSQKEVLAWAVSEVDQLVKNKAI